MKTLKTFLKNIAIISAITFVAVAFVLFFSLFIKALFAEGAQQFTAVICFVIIILASIETFWNSKK